MSRDAPIVGSCDSRFEAVRDALSDNLALRGEIGAAVAVTIDGVPVVDLWGGWMDGSRSRAWQRDTLVDVFSVGKAMAAVCLLQLAERGPLDIEAPVCRYWPEFAGAGKEAITLRMLLSHQAGLPGIHQPLADDDIYDWGTMTAALEREQPWWAPGTKHGYHVNTFGFLVGEVVRRAAGINVGEFFEREVATPLEAEFMIGTGPEYDSRIADYTYGEIAGQAEAAPTVDVADRFIRDIYLNPPGISGIGTVNERRWRAAQMPSTNGHSNARAVARIYSALACNGAVDGVRLLDGDTIELAIEEASAGQDAVLDRPSRFGLGFQLTQPERPLGPNPRSFGHFGAGGSLGFADPDAQLAFGYTMNKAGPRWQNAANKALVDAVYSAL